MKLRGVWIGRGGGIYHQNQVIILLEVRFYIF